MHSQSGQPWLTELSNVSATAGKLAQQLATLMASFGPEVVAPRPLAQGSYDGARRSPIAIASEGVDGALPPAEFLLRTIGVVVVVDGEALQGRRAAASPMALLTAIGTLADSTGASFEVLLPLTAGWSELGPPHPSIRVRFVAAALEREEMFALLAAGYPTSRPLVLVGPEAAVHEVGVQHGANTISVESLLALLRS